MNFHEDEMFFFFFKVAILFGSPEDVSVEGRSCICQLLSLGNDEKPNFFFNFFEILFLHHALLQLHTERVPLAFIITILPVSSLPLSRPSCAIQVLFFCAHVPLNQGSVVLCGLL